MIVYISNETKKQTEMRLLMVISRADFKVLDGLYTFEEFPIDELPRRAKDTALAFVRDEDVWSQLVPSQDTTRELFKVVGFHFEPHLDNSGFVGWLATYLKQKLGTGVFVVCGQNSTRGGAFDYWGCPYSIEESFVEEMYKLIIKGKQVIY